MTWRIDALPPETGSAAEAAARSAGKPLGEWLAETLRAAVIEELGAYPPPTPTSAPAPIPAAPYLRPALSPEVRRVATPAFTSWLAGRIAGPEPSTAQPPATKTTTAPPASPATPAAE